MELWGETVFLPKTRKKGKEEGPLASFLNCYQNSPLSEPSLTVDTVLVDVKGLEVQSELTVSTEKQEEECIEKHVPCLFLNSMVGSKYLLIYFHASGEDIKLSHKLLDLLRNLYQVPFPPRRSISSPCSTPATASTRASPAHKPSSRTHTSSTPLPHPSSASKSRTSSSWAGPSGQGSPSSFSKRQSPGLWCW